MEIPDKVKEGAKAIAGGAVAALVNLLTNLIHGDTPWPQTTSQWLALLGSTLLGAVIVWLQPAKITDKQVEKDPTVIRVAPPQTDNPVTAWTKPNK